MYIKERMVLVVVINSILFSCFGEVYPITDMIEGEDATLSFYVELEEQSFIGIRGEDKIFLEFTSALADKDVARMNSLLAPEHQIDSNKDLSHYEFGKLKGVVKYLYDDYAMFYAKSDSGTYHYAVRRNDKDQRIMLLNNQISQITSPTLGRFFRDEIKVVESDLSEFDTVEYGSNEVVKIHFQYLGEDDGVTQDLKKTRDRLSQAYLEKDFDALANLVGPRSLDGVLMGLMNGNPDPRFKVYSNEPLGAIDMGSVYVYLGHNKEEETVFMDKYIELGGEYRLANYNCFGGPINNFLSSGEFASFIHGKIREQKRVQSEKTEEKGAVLGFK